MNIRRLFFAVAAAATLASPASHALGTRIPLPPPRQFGFGFSEGNERPLLARFDKDGDKKLNASERKAALDFLGRGGRSYARTPAGPKLSPDSIRAVPASTPFYDPGTIRT